ncbi:MAG TPA: carbon starvation CstA family protein, partial [Candidatus Bathyarchaeia archaeon]|nr:carbon starvation CstA family protein [Candidatus Bathyarchaeia archaeon]
MTGIGLLFITLILFWMAYVIYGRYLNNVFQIDPKVKTPATQCEDKVDYVPTRAPVLFGHHFASIAGAGPV